MILGACTEFLARQHLTPYERGLAYNARGGAHLLKGEFDPAIADFSEGIHVFPSSSYFIRRAEAYWAKGSRDLAFSDLDAAVQVEPLSYEPYLQRAERYFSTGAQDRAFADFRKAMSFPTVNPAGLLGRRCAFLTNIGRPQDALAECDKSIGLAAKNTNVLTLRGNAYFKLGQFQRAIQDYDAALKIEPRLWRALYQRGMAKSKIGDAKGHADITAAKAMNPYVANIAAGDGFAP
jgi:tetratricopeptide (TPR) repeat protein